MTSVPETPTTETVTIIMSGGVGGRSTSASVVTTSALTTLLDTIRTTVRDELRKQLPPAIAPAGMTGPVGDVPGPSQPPLPNGPPDASAKEGSTGEF